MRIAARAFVTAAVVGGAMFGAASLASAAGMPTETAVPMGHTDDKLVAPLGHQDDKLVAPLGPRDDKE
ncbi:hypothetical protein AA958_23030 [Streptomyces sp. CNQ-509]|uniref:hypothetical protein n=1 Tax=Streptomyces sp. CNQ-509 TaxID=444103 RepID=UPI00062DE17C|nr:hypothetical protein [Streptomyces sp. CNQ-509]AKH84596.1 hypothetical protein AA958_23030 [Streptomyces sp. CNQ-509]